VYPGPTLEAKMDVTSRIHWDNHIPDEEHFLPVDRSIHWANPKRGGVPTVVHLHGAETESIHDGHPDAWWTPKGEHGPTYVTQHNSYPNTQRPAMLWYHDHVVGITRLNVVAGLSGLYFLRSPEDKLTKQFPYGEYEIPLVFKDWQFWPNGSINFPNVGDNATIHPSWCPEYFGDTILVNGKVWPYLDLQPRVYRFRLLNGANARFFNFTLSDPSLRFHKIGTDGGYLDTKPQILSSLLLAPAERLDILVDFSSLKPGDVVFLNNSAPAPFPVGQDNLNPPQTRSVMKFQVTKKAVPAPNTAAAASTSSAESSIGDHLRHAQLLEQYVEEECNRYSSVNVFQQPENSKLMEQQQGDTSNDSSAPVLRHRRIRLREFDDSNDDPTVSLLENRRWLDPVRAFPVEGSVEVWEWINTTPDAHPIHMHLIQFQVLNQQPFNKNLYVSFSPSPRPPRPRQRTLVNFRLFRCLPSLVASYSRSCDATYYLLTFLPIYLRTSHKQAGYKCRVKPQNECFMGPPVGTQRQQSQVFIKLPSVGLFYTASKAWGVAFYFLIFIPMIPGGWYH
jgi:spore coat protein A